MFRLYSGKEFFCQVIRQFISNKTRCNSLEHFLINTEATISIFFAFLLYNHPIFLGLLLYYRGLIIHLILMIVSFSILLSKMLLNKFLFSNQVINKLLLIKEVSDYLFFIINLDNFNLTHFLK